MKFVVCQKPEIFYLTPPLLTQKWRTNYHPRAPPVPPYNHSVRLRTMLLPRVVIADGVWESTQYPRSVASSLCAPLHSYALACVSAGRVNVRVKYERTWSKPGGWCETDNVAASSCACSIRDGFRGARAPASLAHFPKVTPVFRSPTSFPGRCDV